MSIISIITGSVISISSSMAAKQSWDKYKKADRMVLKAKTLDQFKVAETERKKQHTSQYLFGGGIVLGVGLLVSGGMNEYNKTQKKAEETLAPQSIIKATTQNPSTLFLQSKDKDWE